MFQENEIRVGYTADHRPISLLPKMANRHGLIAGATGTGKTTTLKVLAESFSDAGIPVFMADIKGDLTSLIAPGSESETLLLQLEKCGQSVDSFSFDSYPVTLWDIFGKTGIPLRTTISEMGPLLLARVLQLNELQSDILSIVFKIADDQNLLLVDTKDLKAMLHYVSEHTKDFAASYGKMSPASLGAITRALVSLEIAGGEDFFGEPALHIPDWLTLSSNGKGMIHILDSSSLVNNGTLYSTFLLWFLSELFETLPEVGDLEKPKMVFFFDEAHLLFSNTSKVLLEKIEQIVKLIRSKGVGIYFCTQNPKDIPDGVLAQLGNKIEHGLRAFTPADQKAVRAAADSFRENPAFDTYETILNLGTGEAVISFLDESGVPGICEQVTILPPQSRFGAASEDERENAVKGSLLYSKYAQSHDPDSAYEFLERMGLEAEEKEAEEVKAQENAKATSKKETKEDKAKKKAVKSVANSAAGTVGRQVGKEFGKQFGSFGKTLGGNIGASLGRGIIGTFFK